MAAKPSKFTGLLWVAGIGLMIVSMGLGFLVWVMIEQRHAASPAPSTTNATGAGALPSAVR